MVEIKYQENDGVKLPNNIRQVGTPGDKLKIYIEDYVMTYLNQIAGQKPFGQKAALLLGEKVRKDKTDIFFISAAIHMENLQIKEDNLQITSEIWTGLYERIDKYFREKHILGWFLSRPGQSVGMSAQIEKVQAEQFRDKGTIFYAMDPMDREDAFYVYEKGQLMRHQGYYIYYERNEAMQNYMIELKKDQTSNEETESTGFQNRLFERKTDNKWKKEAYTRSHRAGRRWFPQVAAVVLVVLIAAAIRKNVTDQRMEVSQVVGRSAASETMLNESGETDNLDLVETIMQQAAESISESETVPETTDSSMGETESTVDESGSEASENTDVAAGAHQSYTVKEGDTLLKISRALYQDAAHVEEIIRLNQIEDPDYIYPGMVLQLP